MHMRDKMQFYRLGILVLVGITVLLFIAVLVMAGGRRQDNQTEVKAQAIASKLNSYTAKEEVPDNLGAAGIKDVPSTISYSKKSDTSYEFCATYKRASDNLDTTDFTSVVDGSALSSDSSSSSYDSSDNDSELYIGSHKKGRNCQTITPYNLSGSLYNSKLYDEDSDSGSSGSDCKYDYSKSDEENDPYYTCLYGSSSQTD